MAEKWQQDLKEHSKGLRNTLQRCIRDVDIETRGRAGWRRQRAARDAVPREHPEPPGPGEPDPRRA